jgi:hypothetical protein
MPESQQGSSQSVETTAQFGKGDEGMAKRWLAEIKMYEGEVRDWSKRNDKIIKRYRNERSSNEAALNSNAARGFAMFWANVQTLQPTILANPPKANVTRRFKDDDPVARVASQIAERCLDFFIDQEGYYDTLKCARDDYLLVAQGTIWARYVPRFSEIRVPLQVSDNPSQYQDEDGNKYDKGDIQEDEQGAYTMDRDLDSEECCQDYVNWKDFLRTPGARTWAEVTWVGRRAYMDRDALIDRFGPEKGKAVTLDHEPPKGEWGDKEEKQFFKKGTIYEIWDKASRCVYWVAKNSSMPGLLDKRDDPLKINGFFPCPKPMLGTVTTDKFQPVPDFLMYQDQAQEMDVLTQRIYKLIESIKVKGLFAANIPEFQKLLEDADELDMTPVDQSILAMIGGDMSKSVWFWPIDIMVAALNELITARNVVKQDAYEITGLSDIIRGATDPNETLGAQELKVQSGSIRVRDRQQEMARFIRDGLRIAFDIIFNQFSVDTIKEMCDFANIKEANQPYEPDKPMMGHNGGPSLEMPAQGMPSGAPGVPQAPMGQPAPMPGGPTPMPGMLPGVPQGIPMQPQLPPPPMVGDLAIALLQDRAKRQFRIDIETDSTIEIDQNAEKAARSEFVTAVGGFIEQASPVLAQAPEFIPMFGEMLLFAVRGFKAGDQLENVIEKTMESLKKRAEQQAANPQPNPDQVVAQEKTKQIQLQGQIAQQKAQAEGQRDQVELQNDQTRMQMEQQQAQAELEHDREKMRLEIEKMVMEIMAIKEKANLERQVAQDHAVQEQQIGAMKVDQAREMGSMKTEQAKEMGAIKAEQAAKPKPTNGAQK